jgi:hypothetical protein
MSFLYKEMRGAAQTRALTYLDKGHCGSQGVCVTLSCVSDH